MKSKNKIKTALAAFMTSGLILGGALVVGAPAQASQVTRCVQQWYQPPLSGTGASGIPFGAWLYRDYNWWEETFQLKQDRWEFHPNQWCA